MSEKKPLGNVEKAKLESYHRQQDEALIEQLRQKMNQEKAAAQLAQDTGVTDEKLLGQLASLGITTETVPVLHLVPLLAVAWADGQIQDSERREIEAAAKITGADQGAARTLLDGMLDQGPTVALVDAAMGFISHLIAALPEGQSAAHGTNLAEMAWRVADASGGIFGMWGRVEEAEKQALRKIADHLTAANPEAAAALLGRL